MLNRISHYVKVCDNVEPGIVLKVKSLEIMYMDIFSHRDVEYTSQVSRFVNELISKMITFILYSLKIISIKLY